MSSNFKYQSQAQPEPVATFDAHDFSAPRLWRASAIRRLPWDALLALFAAIACGVLMVVVIKMSDGDLVSNWKVSPAVYLSIISVVANVSLHYAFSRGVDISWWNAAMKNDTKVKDLHNIWLYSTGLRSAFFAGRSFNLVALSAILLAVLPANAPLAQRASRSTQRFTTFGVTIPLVSALKMEPGMQTGYTAQRGGTIAFTLPYFSKVLQNQLVSAPIKATQGCPGGSCRGVVHAAGLKVACTPSDYLFPGLSLMLIGLSAVAVVPLMLRWWRLGRDVSLLPIEIARAFGAHELVAGSGSNSSASQLVKEVGSREVRYGEVAYGQYGGPTVTALAFARPTMVSEPRKGAAY